jgi:hypothetical protein
MNKSEFIIGRQYIVTQEEDIDNLPNYRREGIILTARYDDGSQMPRFTLPAGVTDKFGDNWAYFNVDNVEPYVESESIQPFVVAGIGEQWYIMKPSGEYVNIYFNTTKAAFAVARTLAGVYNA